jgi:hypothetical protein
MESEWNPSLLLWDFVRSFIFDMLLYYLINQSIPSFLLWFLCTAFIVHYILYNGYDMYCMAWYACMQGVEHPQELINKIQYGEEVSRLCQRGRGLVPVADYSLATSVSDVQFAVLRLLTILFLMLLFHEFTGRVSIILFLFITDKTST